MKQLEFLKKMVELGRIPHALLFYGPDNQGKKDMALEFVKLINGEDSARGVHPDLFFVGPAEDTQEIKIAQIRDLHAKLSLRSYSAPFKAAIIEQAHCLNDEAQSAFLKLLEEPKGQTIFILITEYPEMLFPTILSRVEKLRFYSRKKDILPAEEIERLQKIIKGNLAKRFQYAKELAEDQQNLKKALETWLAYFRESLLSDLGQAKTVKILKLLQTTHRLISTTNVNARLALEILM